MCVFCPCPPSVLSSLNDLYSLYRPFSVTAGHSQPASLGTKLSKTKQQPPGSECQRWEWSRRHTSSPSSPSPPLPPSLCCHLLPLCSHPGRSRSVEHNGLGILVCHLGHVTEDVFFCDNTKQPPAGGDRKRLQKQYLCFCWPGFKK